MDERVERPAGPQGHPIKLIDGSRTNTAALSEDGGHQDNDASKRQQLCRVCQSIKLQAPPYWWQEKGERFTGQIIPHYPSHSMLLASASSGCPLCIMIARALDQRAVPRDPRTPGIRNIILLWYRVEGSTYRKRGRDKPWSALEGSREKMGVYEGDPSQVPGMGDYLVGTRIAGGPLRVHAEKGTIASQYIHTRPHPLPDSDEAFDLVQGWIRRCCDEHSEDNVYKCSPCTQELLPTRIIDLEPANGTSVPVLKITDGERGVYITLSHCWGKNLNTKLTTANLEQWTQGIDVSTLPQSFRDAIIVTRRLHIRYLWIDALCILQDSVQDWQIESSKMGNIYLNSFLTIAAANSADCHSGFLSQIPPTPPPCKLDFVSPIGECGEVFVTFYDEPEEPLDSRGWCVQEILLGSRVLTYGTHEIFFECRQPCRMSDTGACLGLPSKSIRSGSRFMLSETDKTEGVKLGNPNSQKIRDIDGFRTLDEIKVKLFVEWYAMIGSNWKRSDYSTRRLTVPSDKLPAVSGLAHQVQEAVRSSYHAGIWADSIAYGLQWQRRVLLQKPERLRAPSWSWASLDGPVKYTTDFQLLYRSGIDIIEIVSAPSGQDLLGEVNSAHIILTGRVLSLTCVARDVPDEYDAQSAVEFYDIKAKYVLMKEGPDEDSQATALFLEKMEDWNKYTRANRFGNFRRDIAPPSACVGWCLFDLPEYYGQSVDCLRTSSMQDVPTGLLLRPTKLEGAFMRIGVWRANHQQEMNFFWDSCVPTKIKLV